MDVIIIIVGRKVSAKLVHPSLKPQTPNPKQKKIAGRKEEEKERVILFYIYIYH